MPSEVSTYVVHLMLNLTVKLDIPQSEPDGKVSLLFA
jgi:hypothetical protein